MFWEMFHFHAIVLGVRVYLVTSGHLELQSSLTGSFDASGCEYANSSRSTNAFVTFLFFSLLFPSPLFLLYLLIQVASGATLRRDTPRCHLTLVADVTHQEKGNKTK